MPFRHPVAAEGNVDIVPKPGGQRNVPAAPKFFDGKRKVRALKVCCKLYAEKLCAADGDIRITGEITVDFNGEHHRNNDKYQSHIAIGIVVYFVYDIGEDIGDHQFFKITPCHQLETISHVFIIEAPLLFKLRQKRVRPAYGAGEKLREKGDEKGVVTEVPFCADFPFVNVDQISHRLEKIEGNAGRQQDFQSQWLQGEPSCADHGVDAVDGGSAQLKNQQDSHKGQDAAQKAEPFSVRSLFQSQSQKIGKNRGKKEQKTVGGMQIHVKGIACCQQKNPSELDRHDMVQDEYRQ